MTAAEKYQSHDLIERVSQQLRAQVEQAVPWFLEQMPESYFLHMEEATVEAHIRAIAAAKASGQPLSMRLLNEDQSECTFVNAGDRKGLLSDLIKQLPKDQGLHAAKVYSARDRSLVLDVFSFQEPPRFASSHPAYGDRLGSICEVAKPALSDQERAALAVFLERCSEDYVMSVRPKRILAHWRLFESVRGAGGVGVELTPYSKNPSLMRLSLVASESAPQSLFRRVVGYLANREIDIRRAHVESFPTRKDDEELVDVMVHLLVDGGRADAPEMFWEQVKGDLFRLPRLDSRVLAHHQELPDASLLQHEWLIALCDLVHQRLCQTDTWTLSREQVWEEVRQEWARCRSLLDVMLPTKGKALFSTKKGEGVGTRRQLATSWQATQLGGIDSQRARHVMRCLSEAAAAILQTNLFLLQRHALSMRIEPTYLHGDQASTKAIPYGVFFFSGDGLTAFHVRFRDIARGGLRVVRTRNAEHFTLEAGHLYDENYSLAFAQQLKNKDIPEGGSKGVILAAPDVSVSRLVRAYGDALLDLLVAAPGMDPDQIIYLGPDENISDELIEWLVARAHFRGYVLPNAFMSSKPDAGINHKEFGVTSEGVVVFLEAALQSIGLDPRETPFTLKMTGGPDGDVGGNAIKIMHREFGDKVQILGIADGSGSAEDPDGLKMRELLRLVEEDLPIASFDVSQLGPQGKVTPLDADGGVLTRNTLHHRIMADAFLPCGGRPSTIHINNWQQFLHDGVPSAKVIVEGANLFLTEDARRALSQEGVRIVKDSSANKCGVVCSSFEIAASMLLSQEAFLAIKEQYVEQVLARLRELARREALLLFRLGADKEQPLSQISANISDSINKATDAIVAKLSDARGFAEDGAALTRRLLLNYMPSALVEAVGEDAIMALPSTYLHRVVASSLAAEMVYREGIAFVEGISTQVLAQRAMEYLKQLIRVQELLVIVRNAGLPAQDEILALLEHGGPRARLQHQLG